MRTTNILWTQGEWFFVPAPEVVLRSGARDAIVTLGGCDAAVREALDVLAEDGMPLDYMRIRGFPFAESVENFLNEHETCLVVEQNRDAQLRSLLTLETSVPKAKLQSVLVYGGFPLSAQRVIEGVYAVHC